MAVLSFIFITLPFVVLLVPQHIEYCLFAAMLATPRLEKWRENRVGLQPSPITRSVTILIIWALAATFWAGADHRGVLIELAVVCVLGGHLLFVVRTLDNHDRNLVAASAVIGFLAAMGLFLLITILDLIVPGRLDWHRFISRQDPLHGQTAAVFTAICWPVIALIVMGRVKVAPVLGRFFIMVCLMGLTISFFRLSSLSGLLSIATGGAALLFVCWQMRLGVVVILVVVLAYLILAPTVHIWPLSVPDAQFAWISPLFQELTLWHNVAERIFVSPIFGFGFQSTISVGSELGNDAVLKAASGMAPPTNLFLLTWLHLGLIGVILFAGVLYAVCRSILGYAQTPLQAAVLSAAAMSILSPAVLGSGTWDLFWIASAWCIGAIGLLLTGDSPAPEVGPSQPAL